MAIISETSDDGSNGGDPNKKPDELLKNPKEEEEEENQNEKPKEEVQEDDQEEEVENIPPIPQDIPQDLIESTVALVRRCHYPKLSLISRAFRHVISSPELFETRSRRGLTEPVLYVLIEFPPFNHPSWFILHRSNISLRLSRVSSLPPMFPGSTTVTIGYKMYVMGGSIGFSQPVSTVIVIDCRFHTWHNLPNMKRARCNAAAGVIDGKIYVVGGRERRYNDWVEVFHVEREVWETVPGPFPSVASSSGEFYIHVVMEEKIYILDQEYCLAYEPRRRRWETWGLESEQRSCWHLASCVVDDMLYAIVPQWMLGSPIVVYDPRVMFWRPVMGVDPWPSVVNIESRVANFGGKLVVLGCYRSRYSWDYYCWVKDVWCVEIALERREDGDIWGKVESISRVNTFRMSPFIELARTVTV